MKEEALQNIEAYVKLRTEIGYLPTGVTCAYLSTFVADGVSGLLREVDYQMSIEVRRRYSPAHRAIVQKAMSRVLSRVIQQNVAKDVVRVPARVVS